ncbi:acyl-CoA dehydrogenase family protein [Pseudarthrobacter sp. fls2-241-R2A-168]|uniref:acyl-CoA dehydrogenase family protein n=1 Tax=Pseudarthrobacter sp. fls2-241-R2A-168 TaxID=3040304 RepID=UPI0025542A27|nr:acyl-CoA dehydrogenase family protein [Pseudarthrobacter sp. fls2-241-R2A-168]
MTAATHETAQSEKTTLRARLYGECDPMNYEALLTDAEQGELLKLRGFLETEAQPLLADYWERGEFPAHLIKPLAALDLITPASLTGGGAKPRSLYEGFRNFELARTDASLATYYNGQSGLFRTTVLRGGSEDQAKTWLPLIDSFEMTGVFALTEPEHGSDIAGGLTTSARRSGNTWVINGEKRWIGNAAFADYLAVLARDVADGQIKAFLVKTDAPGVTLKTIGGKMSLRMVQNSDISLDNVEVTEEFRLARINSFADVADLLRSMRSGVAWFAAGVQAGAYEAALKYAADRQQFGRPISGFQMIQDKLVGMLGNTIASLGMVVRLSQQQDEGVYRDQDSAMAKAWTCSRMRETVASAREIAGGNGILLSNDVGRFFADAEAIYTYEGTKEINTLVVGRAITGRSAFTR